MSQLKFLSDDWLAEAKRLGDEAGAASDAAGLKLNLVVTGTPDGDRQIHIDDGAFGAGTLADAPTTVTLPYDTAKKVFLDGDQQAAMQAFMAGQIKVVGDMTKLMQLQSQGGGGQAAVLERLKAVTVL